MWKIEQGRGGVGGDELEGEEEYLRRAVIRAVAHWGVVDMV